ncbi:MAG: GNAT family N-acetyltransferase [Paracoccaceae bacterium]
MSEIIAKEIDFHTLHAIMDLKTRPDQQHLVAPNSVTVAQFHYEPSGWLRGLWAGETPVGLIAMINPQIESPSFEEGDSTDAAYLWRLMIDQGQQGKGYGHQAMHIAFAQARAWSFAKFQTSCVPGENCPIPFYEACGLQKTGQIVGGEIELMGPVPAEL